MHKKVGAALGAIVLLPILAGCGGAPAAPVAKSGPTNLTWMVWGSPAAITHNMAALKKAYPSVAKQYKITPIVGGSSDFAVAQKFRLELASNSTVPDIIELNYTEVPEFAGTGAILNLTPYYKPYLSKMTPAAIKIATYHGQQWDFPFLTKTKLWYYRKDMFAKAGINPANIHTLSQLIAAGKQLQKAYPHSYIWNLGQPLAQYDIGMVLSGNGGAFTNSKGDFVINSNPGVRRMFLAFKRLQDSGVVANVVDFTPQWSQDLANGTIASTLGASWLNLFLPTYAPKLSGKWGIAQWPTIAGSVGGSEAGGSVFLIPSNAPHKRAAINLLTKLLLTKSGGIAEYQVAGTLPLLTSALNSPKTEQPIPYFGSAYRKEIRQSLTNFKIFPYDPKFTQEITIVQNYLMEYLTNKMTLSQALSGAQKTCVTQIGNAYAP